ncbi:MAG: NmrA family NAD(P)-binding protein [Actinobacteria bacterium]|nr:NmrA family NAD(P)-binding protein [Actinomycetota bacterium]
MILVTAAHGTQARRLIPRLAAAGTPVRGLRRAGDAEEVRALGASEVIVGDAADPEVLARAMRGVTAVYHVGPTAHPCEAEIGVGVVNAAAAAGVGHFVYASVLHARISALYNHRAKLVVEEQLVGAGMPFTILQPADFMETLNYRRAFRDGVFRLIWSLERRQALVSVEDLAAVGARVLTEGETHFGATYELSSAGCWTAHEIAAEIGRLAGREVVAERLDVEAVLGLYGHDEYGEEGERYRRDFFDALIRWYDNHDFVGNPWALRTLLGREPLDLPAFLAARLPALEARP